jgi:hypothetical protein
MYYRIMQKYDGYPYPGYILLDRSLENANFAWSIIEIDNDFVRAFYFGRREIQAILFHSRT